MHELDIPALSLAISINEKLKYAAGFGYADVRRKEIVTPLNQFRIGSVLKPITAAAVLILVEKGLVDLDKKVFGSPKSIFGNEFAKKKPYDHYITDITVRNLVEHTSGLGWFLNIMGFNGWQHDGRMPGSAAMLMQLDNGLEMALVVNKEYSERDFFHKLGYILHHIGNNCNWCNTQIDLYP